MEYQFGTHGNRNESVDKATESAEVHFGIHFGILGNSQTHVEIAEFRGIPVWDP